MSKSITQDIRYRQSLMQYTAIDEYTRLRYLGAYPEQAPILPLISWRKWQPGSSAVVYG